MVSTAVRWGPKQGGDSSRSGRDELVQAVRRVAEQEFADISGELRARLIRDAVNEALLVLAELEAVGAGRLAYPRALVRTGIARMGCSLA